MLESVMRTIVRGANALRGIGVAYALDAEARAALRFLRGVDDLVVCDVGANAGQYTLAVQRLLGQRRARYLLVEPSPDCWPTLERVATSLPGGGEIVRHALGARAGPGSLYQDRAASPVASLYPRRLDHLGVALDRVQAVEVVTLDEACTDRGVQHVHLLKLDVEGHELEVLRGAAGLLDRGAIDVIQFEFGGCNIDSRTYFQDFWYLLKDRFDFHRVVPLGSPLPVRRYTEDLEQFVTTNYVLARRGGL